MDFHDPDKKRYHGIRLFVGYVLIAITIAMGATILLFRSYGYDLDRKTGKVIQNGLIFVSSKPTSVSVNLNTVNKGSTDARLTLPAGQYALELKHDGYRTWKKTFSLEGGSIERFVYPLLFPTNLITKDIQLYGSSPFFASGSPDRHWLVVGQPGSIDKFDVVDMNSPGSNPTSISLPAGLLTASTGPQNLSLVEWSSDNRHVLLKHVFDNNLEFVILDREVPASSYNVNKTFSVNPTQVTLRDKHYDTLYVYDAKTKQLQKADLKSKAVTGFINGVLSYKSRGSGEVLYASDVGAPTNKVNLQIRDGDNTYTMRTLPVSDEYLLELTQFDGSWYMAAGTKSDNHIYIYKNPFATLKQSGHSALVPVSIMKIDAPQFMSFSENTKFLAVQSGSRFAVYDAETDKRYYYKLDNAIEASQKAVWMDGYRLNVTYNSKIVVFDYDGINVQTLSASQPEFGAYFDRDYTGMYTIAPSVIVPGKPALTRTELRVN